MLGHHLGKIANIKLGSAISNKVRIGREEADVFRKLLEGEFFYLNIYFLSSLIYVTLQ